MAMAGGSVKKDEGGLADSSGEWDGIDALPWLLYDYGYSVRLYIYRMLNSIPARTIDTAFFVATPCLHFIVHSCIVGFGNSPSGLCMEVHSDRPHCTQRTKRTISCSLSATIICLPEAVLSCSLPHVRSPGTSADTMLRRSPGHSQQFEDASFVMPLDEMTLCQLLPLLASQDILVESALVEAHALLAGQEPHAAVEDIVASEVYQRRSNLCTGHKQQVDPTPYQTAR